MKIKNIILFILIILIGTFLRIYNLGKYDFWFDEAFSILLAQDIANFSTLAKDIVQFNVMHHIIVFDQYLFYLLLSFWQHLGNSEFILRLLPAIFGILSIFAIYWVSKELFNKRVGLISAFILTISPFHIYYSQELRTYSLVTFLSLITIYYFIKSLKVNKVIYWGCFVIFATLLLYSYTATLLLIITVSVFLFLFYKSYSVIRKRYLISLLFIILFYLPRLRIIFEYTYHIKVLNALQWIPRGYLFNFIRTFFIFNLGCNVNQITHLLGVLVLLPLFLLGIWNSKKKEIYSPSPISTGFGEMNLRETPQRYPVIEVHLLLLWLFLPIVITIAISKLIIFIFLFRVLIYTSGAYYILIAYGLSKIKSKKVFFCFLLLFTVLSSISLSNYYRNAFYFLDGTDTIPFKKEVKLAMGYIEDNFQEKDVVGHTHMVTWLPSYYYIKNRLPQKIFTLGYPINFDHSYYYFYSSRDKNYNIRESMPADIRSIIKDKYKRIWLVLPYDKHSHLYVFSQRIKEYLDRDYFIRDRKKFAGITVYLYQAK